MSKKFSDLTDKMSPEAKKKVGKRTQELLGEEKMLKEAEEFSNSDKKVIVKEGGEEMADGSGMIKYGAPQEEPETEREDQ